MHPFLWILLCALLSGCAGSEGDLPPGVISSRRFASLYADLLIMGAVSGQSPADSLQRPRTVDSLLTLHGVTRAGFDSTVAWYNADPHRWRAVMDSVTRTLEGPHPR